MNTRADLGSNGATERLEMVIVGCIKAQKYEETHLNTEVHLLQVQVTVLRQPTQWEGGEKPGYQGHNPQPERNRCEIISREPPSWMQRK